jgi:hypothetical protein
VHRFNCGGLNWDRKRGHSPASSRESSEVRHRRRHRGERRFDVEGTRRRRRLLTRFKHTRLETEPDLQAANIAYDPSVRRRRSLTTSASGSLDVGLVVDRR